MSHRTFAFLEQQSIELEAAKSRTEKTALLKKLTDYRSLNECRTGIIRLERSDVNRLIELMRDRNPALTQKLSGFTALTNNITVLPSEIEFLLAIVQHS
ncbi:MAG: hypothetical protein KME10_11635 [Plectolyngbya sp. WJT66-NPBG17]|jgi:hypothetical protein|nr:hypothetical protein [Plectolyngbya sp. WJT66-NPBG17]